MADQTSTAGRDDHVFTGTRVLGAVIVPFLLVAFALLYFFPDDTRHWFAWDVQPTLTPLIMGAGYVAGAYFFVRVAVEKRWHRVQVGFLPVTAFTQFMAIGTFNHLDRFATAHVAFWIWVGLYVVTPVLVPLVGIAGLFATLLALEWAMVARVPARPAGRVRAHARRGGGGSHRPSASITRFPPGDADRRRWEPGVLTAVDPWLRLVHDERRADC